MARRKPKPCEVVRWMKVKDGQAIRRWRKRRDLTQRQLAFLVSTSQTTIYLIETGGMKTLTEKLALAIAKRLDVAWEELFVAEEAARVPSVTNDVHSVGQAIGA